MTQIALLLDHLQTGQTLTPLEAFQLCGTLACHSQMAELRKQGYDIHCEMIKTNSGKRVGRYSLLEHIPYG